MNLKRVLSIAVVGLAVLPATAAAQATINPPDGDNYLGPLFINDETSPFSKDEIGFVGDTTSYTTQSDLFNPPSSGSVPESAVCGQANTIWSVFFSNRFGEMDISTAGVFDSVIGVATFNSPSDPAPKLRVACADRLTGLQEETKFLVKPKQWYAVQVGGTGSPAGGKVQVKFHLLPPPRISGADGVLSMTGRKVTKLVMKAPKGAKISLHCAKKSCGRLPRAFTSKKPALLKPIGAVGFATKAAPGAAMTQAAVVPVERVAAPRARSGGAQVRAAKSFTLLKGKVLPSGTLLEARITEAGHIGTYFGWQIGPAGITKKLTQCMKPGSTKPRKKCT